MRVLNKVAAGHDADVVNSRLLITKQHAVGGSALVNQGKARVLTGSGVGRPALGDVSNVLLQRNARNSKGKTANSISKRPVLKPTATAVSAAAAVAAMKMTNTKKAAPRAIKDPCPQRGAVVVDTNGTQTTSELVQPPQDWQDLDKPELDDPLTCAEYSPEIFQYLRELEPGTMPNPAYCEHQPEMNHKMRNVLLDWMVEVHQNFKMIPETLYLAINILNCYLSLMQVSSNTLQLAAITALFIAAKVEEIAIPEIKEFAYMADNAYRPEDIRRAERHMLHTMNFRLSYPNPMNFLRRISKADDYDMLSRTIGKYLLEIAVVDHRFMGFPPSLLAAAAMYLARHILKRGNWNATLAHYAGYTEDEILPVVSLLVEYIGEPVHESLFNKYAGKKFCRSSIIVREWYNRRTNGFE